MRLRLLGLFEIARLLVRLDHVACVIINASHKATEWQNIENQIGAAMIFGRTQFWSAAVLCRFSAFASIAKCYCLRLKRNR